MQTNNSTDIPEDSYLRNQNDLPYSSPTDEPFGVSEHEELPYESF
jgi:hypothetical protein